MDKIRRAEAEHAQQRQRAVDAAVKLTQASADKKLKAELEETVARMRAEAEEAQEHLMKLPARFNKLAQRQAKSLAKKPREPKEWAWLNGRVV